MRIVKIFLLVLVVALVGLYLGRNSLVRAAVGHFGSQALGTEVVLEKVNISPFSGLFRLEGLQVANPSGFPAGNTLALNTLSVSFEPATLLGNTVVVDDILIEGVQLNVINHKGRTNLAALQKETAGGEGKSEAAKAAPQDGKGKEVTIKTLTLKNVSASLNLPVRQGVKVDLPEVVVRNISTGSSGLGNSLRGAFPAMLGFISKQAMGQGGVPSQLLKEVEKAPEIFKNKATDALNKTLDDASDKLNKKLRGIFGQ